MLIDIKLLAKKYNINSKGVLHIGAHIGQESDTYHELGMDKMFFIEGSPVTFPELQKNISRFSGAVAIPALISDEDAKDVTFHVSSNDGQSSSILELGTHKNLHPEVHYTAQMGMKTTRIDTLFKYKDLSGVDFLNIDIQGMELPALKGMGNLLNQFKYAYLEVNREQVYEGCAEIGEIDEYLKGFGFIRKETEWVNGWGDAFYIKERIEVLPDTYQDILDYEITPTEPAKIPIQEVKKEEGMILQVEETFLRVSDSFEAWFAQNITSAELKNRIYIPIQWNAYYSYHGWGRDMSALSWVQTVLDRLDQNRKYFTICEWKEGIMQQFNGKDIKIFGPAGMPNIDYAIDLTKSKEDIKKYILDIINN